MDRLYFNRVSKRFGKRDVLSDVDLELCAGTIHALAGVNGSGKSTLFQIGAGFEKQMTGNVTIGVGDDAVVISSMPPYQRVQIGVRYIPQTRPLLKGLTPFEHLQLAVSGSANPKLRSREIYEFLGEHNLMHVLNNSHNEQTRAHALFLLLASALLAKPRYLLLDEPFAGLCSHERADCGALILEARRAGTGILLTDHNERALLSFADYVTILEDGKVVYRDTVHVARTSKQARALYFRSIPYDATTA